jgi:ankyrin repeat protein
VSIQYILAEYNFPNLIEALPLNTSWLKQEGERYGLSVFAALAMGNKEAVQAILRFCAIQKPQESKLLDIHTQYVSNVNGRKFFGREFKFSNKDLLLHIAALGDEMLFAFLLENGFSPNDKDKDGRTPLHWAAERNCEEIVKLLLADQRVDPNTRDNEGKTPLFWACCNGVDAVKVLLNDQCVDPITQDKDGRTPLSWAAGQDYSYSIDVDIVKALLADPRVDPSTQDKNGRTPLSWAAGQSSSYSIDIVKALLADPRVDPSTRIRTGVLRSELTSQAVPNPGNFA